MHKTVLSLLRIVIFVGCSVCFTSVVSAQQLKIVHINVGQGDSTLVIGPNGTTLLFDAGPSGNGAKLRQIFNKYGLTSLNYFIAGHYHADHIGSIDELLATGITITNSSYDRGGSYTTQTFTDYVNAVGSKRKTILLKQIIDLGAGATAECVAVDGQTPNGTVSTTGSDGNIDENARSIAIVIRYGTFDYIIASDLTGGGSSGGVTKPDVETKLAPYIGDVDVMHVSHHGSRTSTNQTWVNTLKAEQSVISLGDGNTFGHPTQDVLDRLTNSANMINIWQTQAGSGGNSPKVRVGGDIEFTINGSSYTIVATGYNLTYSTDGTNSGGNLNVVINEIGWSGSATSPNDEWIELYNPTSQSISLNAWKIVDDNGAQTYNLSGTIPAGGYYLIERSQSATSVAANLIVSGLSLANTGDKLVLVDSTGKNIDIVNSTGGAWYAGDNTNAHRTMERVSVTQSGDLASNWRSNNGAIRNGSDSGGQLINGTPKAKNSATP
ncbi:MAG: lamin tail domain-containing protein [Acidobacteriota bacterium]